MKTRFWATLLFMPFLAVCCGNKPTPEVEPAPVITIDGASEFSWGCEGGSATVTFSSDHDWTVSIDEDWITADPASGKSGNGIILGLTCAKNPKNSVRDM